MTTYYVTIGLDNDAFTKPTMQSREVVRILRHLADCCEVTMQPAARSLQDSNGNTVGSAEVVED